MSLRSKQIFLYIIICVIFSTHNVLAIGVGDPAREDPVVVLFDEGHGQFFNRSLYSQAISDLIKNKSMKIVFNRGELNNTSFEGVDIFVSTNPQLFYSVEEGFHINRFLTQGNSMFLMANPLNEDNETLTGRGDIFNAFLEGLEFVFFMGNFWADTIYIGDHKPADVVYNEFVNAGTSEYLHLTLNSTGHEILSISKNITSIVTYSCSLESAIEKVILGSPEAYAEKISGEIHLFSTEIILLGASSPEIETGAKVLLGGSSIMFSDLYDPVLNSSWYESENNSLLWLNIFDWLAEVSPETLPPSFLSEQISFIILTLVVASIIFLLVGVLFFLVGSGQKISIAKSGEEIVAQPELQTSADKAISPSSVQPSPPSKKSRRDRRLRQIKKHHRRKKK